LNEELLAEKIHKVYCKYRLEVHGSEYWTKGDYSLLDEKTKEADRYMARFIMENFIDKELSVEPLVAPDSTRKEEK